MSDTKTAIEDHVFYYKRLGTLVIYGNKGKDFKLRESTHGRGGIHIHFISCKHLKPQHKTLKCSKKLDVAIELG